MVGGWSHLPCRVGHGFRLKLKECGLAGDWLGLDKQVFQEVRVDVYELVRVHVGVFQLLIWCIFHFVSPV